MTIKEEVSHPTLGMKVFHETIYHGKELMKVVGIRENEVELEGDYSGGIVNVSQSDWLPLKGTFRLREVCENHKNGESCKLHNIHCAYPDCEPYTY